MIKNTIFGKVKYNLLEGKKGVKEAYDLMADYYDFSKYLFWTREMEKGEERIVDKWINFLSGKCLDVGCGTGRYTVKIAKKGYEIIALDISFKMLKKIKEKLNKSIVLNRTNLILADAEHLPFKERIFKSLICTLAINHFENIEKVAKEFSRVSEKSSIFIISTFNSKTLEKFQKRHQIPKDKIPFRTENMPPTLIYEVGYSAEDIKKLFIKYGFKILEIKGCCYWHIFPTILIGFYPTIIDSFFNLFKRLLKYAEIHLLLMEKTN